MPRPTARAQGRAATPVAIAPEHRERERKRDRHVPEQHAADARHPQERGRVAADVAHLEQPEGQAEQHEHDERREDGDHTDGKPRERHERRGRAAADTRTPSGPRGSDRPAPGRARARRARRRPPAGTRSARPRRGARPSALSATAPAMTTTAKNTRATVPSPGREPVARCSGPRTGSVGGRPHRLMMAAIPEVVCTRMR